MTPPFDHDNAREPHGRAEEPAETASANLIRQAERLAPLVVETKAHDASPRGDERRSIG